MDSVGKNSGATGFADLGPDLDLSAIELQPMRRPSPVQTTGASSASQFAQMANTGASSPTAQKVARKPVPVRKPPPDIYTPASPPPRYPSTPNPLLELHSPRPVYSAPVRNAAINMEEQASGGDAALQEPAQQAASGYSQNVPHVYQPDYQPHAAQAFGYSQFGQPFSGQQAVYAGQPPMSYAPANAYGPGGAQNSANTNNNKTAVQVAVACLTFAACSAIEQAGNCC